MRNTFKVYERLKREQHINTLFLTGKAFSVFPIRIIYKIIKAEQEAKPEETPSHSNPPLPAPALSLSNTAPRTPLSLSSLQVGFSVPKKKFRSSVHRHRVRRLMAEAWRLHKAALIHAIPPGSAMHVFLVFTGKELPQYEEVKKSVTTAIEKLKTIVSVS